MLALAIAGGLMASTSLVRAQESLMDHSDVKKADKVKKDDVNAEKPACKKGEKNGKCNMKGMECKCPKCGTKCEMQMVCTKCGAVCEKPAKPGKEMDKSAEKGKKGEMAKPECKCPKCGGKCEMVCKCPKCGNVVKMGECKMKKGDKKDQTKKADKDDQKAEGGK